MARSLRSHDSTKQATCCQFAGTWNLGQCATDNDCGAPVMPSHVSRTLNINKQCCSTCHELNVRRCGGDAAHICDTCSDAVPCLGYAISKSATVNSTVGGLIRLANGAGMQIPPGVWPEGVSFSQILMLLMQWIT